ncbi:MAG TPA: DUF4192 family protein, partial [Mycobacteriales bacterium]|nr:DUF4192 family protein [Mycobacteriales bacterium]
TLHDRSELLACVYPADGDAVVAAGTAQRSIARRLAARRAAGAPARGLGEETDAFMVEALTRCADPHAVIDDVTADQVLVGLTDVAVRDALILCAVLSGAEALVIRLAAALTRRAAPGFVAAPASVLAAAAYLVGDGALANVALDRALADDPGYPLAGLLGRALALALPPDRLRGLLTGSAATAGARECAAHEDVSSAVVDGEEDELLG